MNHNPTITPVRYSMPYKTTTRSGRRRDYSAIAVKGCRQASRPVDMCSPCVISGATGSLYIEGCLSPEAATSAPVDYPTAAFAVGACCSPRADQVFMPDLCGAITQQFLTQNRDRFAIGGSGFP